jgi:hypothetical protein
MPHFRCYLVNASDQVVTPDSVEANPIMSSLVSPTAASRLLAFADVRHGVNLRRSGNHRERQLTNIHRK